MAAHEPHSSAQTVRPILVITNATSAARSNYPSSPGLDFAVMDGKRTSFGYDFADRQAFVPDPPGDLSQTRYDAASRKVASIDALNDYTTLVYDPAIHVAACRCSPIWLK